MTLRDYFAAKAMPIVLQQFVLADRWAEEGDGQIAKLAYALADAMLEERQK